MVRNMIVADIAGIDLASIREVEAAVTMRRLLKVFKDRPHLAIAVALTRKGNGRIIRPEDAAFIADLVRFCGAEKAWRICCRVGMFQHMDLPTLPGFSFDLNVMSDNDCKNRFRFDHYGIQRLAVTSRFATW